jgi:hypothetical protein
MAHEIRVTQDYNAVLIELRMCSIGISNILLRLGRPEAGDQWSKSTNLPLLDGRRRLPRGTPDVC